MATSNFQFTRPRSFLHVQLLIWLYATILSTIATYSFLLANYSIGFLLTADTTLMLALSLNLFSSARQAWNATLVTLISEPVGIGIFLAVNETTLLVLALIFTIVLSPITILELTDWDLEVFFRKEFAFPPVAQWRALQEKR